MVMMSVQEDWISVAKAAKLAGCSEQFIRRKLLEYLPKDAKGEPVGDRTSGGRIEGWLVNGRAWLVSRASAEALRGTLTTRATVHRETAKAPVVRKVAAKRRRKTR